MYKFKTVVPKFIPTKYPNEKINYKYISHELDKIKNLLSWQSTVFRRQNHPTLDNTLEELIYNVKEKK